jgi:hypothetical protein
VDDQVDKVGDVGAGSASWIGLSLAGSFESSPIGLGRVGSGWIGSGCGVRSGIRGVFERYWTCLR